MERGAVLVARRKRLVALAVASSIGGGAFDACGAEAKPRFPCASGQIYRVSKKICVPKEALRTVSAGQHESADSPAPERPESHDIRSAPVSSEPQSLAPAPAQEAPPQEEAQSPQSLEIEVPTFDDKAALESVLQLRLARESTTSQLEDIVVFCRIAVKSYRREEAPIEWAAIRNNLANALVALDERKNGMGGLVEATALYREALTEKTRESAPRDWAAIQTNLAEALTILGLRENAVPKLAEAAAVKREAQFWAKRIGDEGVARMRLAEQLGDKEAARTALAQIDLALTTIQGGDDGGLLGAYYEEQLPKARALVEKLTAP
jgi:tetratricopeptide (TPR) repeat protein